VRGTVVPIIANTQGVRSPGFFQRTEFSLKVMGDIAEIPFQ
jgi:hypothetical protein